MFHQFYEIELFNNSARLQLFVRNRFENYSEICIKELSINQLVKLLLVQLEYMHNIHYLTSL